jgi:hypothetical protein
MDIRLKPGKRFSFLRMFTFGTHLQKKIGIGSRLEPTEEI